MRLYNQIFKITFFLQIVVLFMFIWRSVFEYIGINQIVYFFEILLIVFNFILINLSHIKNNRSNKGLTIYIIWGIFIFLLSMIIKNAIIAGMGMASLFMSVLIWKFSLITFTNYCKYSFLFLYLYVIGMMVNSVVAVYQYYIDPSFFGIVHGLYGDNVVMSMNNVTIRSVGLMGSPQSFSASCGVALFLSALVKNKWLRFFSIILISIGGFFSGSRAFGIFFIFFVLYFFMHMRTRQRIIALIVLGSLLLLVGTQVLDSFSNNDTLSRNFTFSQWAAKSIFFSSFTDFNWYDYIIGKGFGLEGWGDDSLKNISFDYSSTESAFLSIVYQLGIVGALFFLLAYIKVFINSYKNSFCICLMIPIFLNLCFTPAFIGFAYSYISWGVLMMLNNRIIGK